MDDRRCEQLTDLICVSCWGMGIPSPHLPPTFHLCVDCCRAPRASKKAALCRRFPRALRNVCRGPCLTKEELFETQTIALCDLQEYRCRDVCQSIGFRAGRTGPSQA